MNAPVIRFEQVEKCYRLGSTSSLRESVSQWLRPRSAKRAEASSNALLWALRAVDLAISPGETVGVIGPNGAGKTTILKRIAGITHPKAGRVQINGRASSLIELGAGFNPDLTLM